MIIGIAQCLYEFTYRNDHWVSMRHSIPISQPKIIPATPGVKEEIYHDQK